MHGLEFISVFKLKVRVDFETFEISPPDNRGQCVTDFFLVTGGSPVPSICGLNTGQHGKYFRGSFKALESWRDYLV